MNKLCRNGLVAVFVLLICGSVLGREIVIRPTSVVSGFDQWGQVGSGTKIQKITDAVNGNFIATTIVGDTDIFELTDVVMNNGEYADSLVLWVKAGSGAIELATLQNNLMIGSNRVVGSSLSLAAGFIDYSVTFTALPGTRLYWDDGAVDSVRLEQFLSEVTADSGKITSDSIVVYTTYHITVAGASKAAGFATLFGKCNNTQQKSISPHQTLRPLDTGNVRIPAAALVNTNKYLIFYGASMGGRTSTGDPEFICLYSRGDTLGHGIYETASVITETGNRTGNAGGYMGFAFITANGTDSLYDLWKNSANDSIFASGHCLISIDFTNQTANTHYYVAQTNLSDLAVMTDTNNTNTSDTTLLSADFTTAAGDHLVLMAAEVLQDQARPALTGSGGKTTYAYIDGAARKKTGKLTWEADTDEVCWMSAEIVNLTAASHNFRIRGGNRNLDTTDVPMRRGKIFVIDLSYWPDKAYSQIATDSVVTNAYATWETHLQVALTPSVSQQLFVIGNAYGRTTAGTTTDIHTMTRIQNATDATSQSEVSAYNPRDDEDTCTNTSFGFIDVSGTSSKTWNLQNCKQSATNTVAASDGTLLVLGMKENLGAAAPKIIMIQMGEAIKENMFNRLLSLDEAECDQCKVMHEIAALLRPNRNWTQ